MKVYALIQVQPGKEDELSKGLSTFQNVKSADLVHGPYNMVLVFEGDITSIEKTLMRVKKIPYIEKTELLLKQSFIRDISYLQKPSVR